MPSPRPASRQTDPYWTLHRTSRSRYRTSRRTSRAEAEPERMGPKKRLLMMRRTLPTKQKGGLKSPVIIPSRTKRRIMSHHPTPNHHARLRAAGPAHRAFDGPKGGREAQGPGRKGFQQWGPHSAGTCNAYNGTGHGQARMGATMRLGAIYMIECLFPSRPPRALGFPLLRTSSPRLGKKLVFLCNAMTQDCPSYKDMMRRQYLRKQAACVQK